MAGSPKTRGAAGAPGNGATERTEAKDVEVRREVAVRRKDQVFVCLCKVDETRDTGATLVVDVWRVGG